MGRSEQGQVAEPFALTHALILFSGFIRFPSRSAGRRFVLCSEGL
jgi:hypothetical protein